MRRAVHKCATKIKRPRFATWISAVRGSCNPPIRRTGKRRLSIMNCWQCRGAAQATIDVAEFAIAFKNVRRPSFVLCVRHDVLSPRRCSSPEDVMHKWGGCLMLGEKAGHEGTIQIRSNLHCRRIYKSTDPAIAVVEPETILRSGIRT
jgi:hypothetical protein